MSFFIDQIKIMDHIRFILAKLVCNYCDTTTTQVRYEIDIEPTNHPVKNRYIYLALVVLFSTPFLFQAALGR